MILQNVFRINKTYNIHGAHPPNRAPRDRLWKRQPLQRWRQPPNLLAKPGRPLRVVSPLRLALQDVWRVAIAICRHGSADHWPHFKTHARKVWGHATFLGQLLLPSPSVERTALARPRSGPAQILATRVWQAPPELLNSVIVQSACSWAKASGRGPRACSPLLLRRPMAS